jgi:hypothetical protein
MFDPTSSNYKAVYRDEAEVKKEESQADLGYDMMIYVK